MIKPLESWQPWLSTTTREFDPITLYGEMQARGDRLDRAVNMLIEEHNEILKCLDTGYVPSVKLTAMMRDPNQQEGVEDERGDGAS
jgi:hypothetical protein|tara:strand:+ start:2088 stop:2345 length:258 start_codon:yes stop_codon:yes gene_type:complete